MPRRWRRSKGSGNEHALNIVIEHSAHRGISASSRHNAVYRNGELRRQFDKYQRRRPPPSVATAVGSPLPRPEQRSAGRPIGALARAEHEQTETSSLA
jgi:hypothetical protein